MTDEASSVLVPMTEAGFADFLNEAVPAFAVDKVASGQWALQESLKLSQACFAELLPLGLATPDNYLFEIRDTDGVTAVGCLWFAVQAQAETQAAYVYDVSVSPEHRRKGHATRAFLALEAKVEALGLAGIALHVFGHNDAARALYVTLGYRATNINMFKGVAEPPAAVQRVIDPAYIAERLAVLQQLAVEWGPAVTPRPDGMDYLDGHEEFVAIALAAGRDSELMSPAAEFVVLPYWLQKWVLESWEMQCHVGRRLGVPG